VRPWASHLAKLAARFEAAEPLPKPTVSAFIRKRFRAQHEANFRTRWGALPQCRAAKCELT
jgi:anti-sigma-K factor RskA